MKHTYKYPKGQILFHKKEKTFWRIVKKTKQKYSIIGDLGYDIAKIEKRTNVGKTVITVSEFAIERTFFVVTNIDNFKTLYGV